MYFELVKEYWYICTVCWLLIGFVLGYLYALLQKSVSPYLDVSIKDVVVLTIFGPSTILIFWYELFKWLEVLWRRSEFLSKPFLK